MQKQRHFVNPKTLRPGRSDAAKFARLDCTTAAAASSLTSDEVLKANYPKLLP